MDSRVSVELLQAKSREWRYRGTRHRAGEERTLDPVLRQRPAASHCTYVAELEPAAGWLRSVRAPLPEPTLPVRTTQPLLRTLKIRQLHLNVMIDEIEMCCLILTFQNF